MKILIVDDEQPARDLVKNYLSVKKEIQIIGEASNGFDGYKLANELKPDVILLDIQMPKLNGFEMLELLDNPPSIIFCTAYEEFAIKAFEQNAIDYLLKPFSKERLFDAIAKIDSTKIANAVQEGNVHLAYPLSRIVVKNINSIDIVPVERIHFLMSQDDYVEIYTIDNKYLKQQRLKYYEVALDHDKFIRVHRQYIVNIEQIKKLDKFGKESYLAQLHRGNQIPISASGYVRLKKVLDL